MEPASAIALAALMSATEREVEALVAGEPAADLIASEAGTFRAAVGETGMPSEEVPGDLADLARGRAALEGLRALALVVEDSAAAPPAWDHEVEAASVVVVAAGGAGSRPGLWNRT